MSVRRSKIILGKSTLKGIFFGGEPAYTCTRSDVGLFWGIYKWGGSLSVFWGVYEGSISGGEISV